MKILRPLLWIVLIFLLSCKKNSSDSPAATCEISMTSISGDYIEVSNVSKGDNGDVIDNFDGVEDCVTDNMWTFAPNGYLYVKDIGLTCSPASNYIQTWSVVGNEMHFSSGIVPIKSFNCKTLILEGQDVYNGATYTTTITYKKY